MIDDLRQKMSNAVGHLEKEFNTIRTSRANPSMLDNIFADAYGSKTPLNQLGNISTPDPSTITIQVWDTSLLKSIESSIIDSGLGINPHYGTPLNPWNRDEARIPGGSSSGAAVSVSDNMAVAGIGTDTGGSVRIPSAL